jgi:TRAP-type C4-dicarboxylate transport system permease small subunit
MLQTVIDRLCRLLSLAMVVFLALMVIMVFGNVVLRYAFNSGITVSEELSRWLFVWMTFLGALIAVRNHTHLGTDSLVSRLPVAGRKVCLGASQLLMLYLCWLMFRGAWQQTVINWATESPVMGASMGWFYASGLFFATFAALFILNDFARLVTGRLADSELIAVSDSEDEVPHVVEPAAAAGK